MFRKSFKSVIAVVMAASIIMQHGNAVQAMENVTEEIVSTGDDTTVPSDASTEDSSEDKSEEPDKAATGSSEAKSDEAAEGSSEKVTDPEPEEADAEDSAEEETESEEAADEASDETADESLTDAQELPEGINGMPEGYKLSDTQEELKKDAVSHDALSTLENLTEGEDYVKNQVVTLADSREEAEDIANAYSGKLESFEYGVAVISLSESDLSTSEAFAYSLSEDYDLPYVEPNYKIDGEEPVSEPDLLGSSSTLSASKSVPTGNGFADRWWIDKITDPLLNPENAQYQWHHDMVNTYSAWGVTTGSNKVTVAVIDTGVNTSHADLTAGSNGSKVTAEIILSGAEGGDVRGHGTHVAGIIAGRINGKLGAGIAPGVNILSLKVTSGGGVEINSDALVKAVNNVAGYSADGKKTGSRRADIINMSLGGSLYSSVYQKAINNAYSAGVTVVAAMGNDNSSNHIKYPAAYDHVIAVCSVDQSGSLSYFSTYGSWADISAPGTGIYSACSYNNGIYIPMDGTSMACPVVSGACALYMSAVGHVDPDTMERVLKSAVTGSAGSGTGAGILDLSKMFNGDTTAPKITLSVDGTVNTVIGEAQDAATYNVTYDVAKSYKLSFTPQNFNGNAEGNAATKIVYTTDGKAPAVLNGEVLSGTAITSKDVLTVGNLIGDIKDKTKVTVKAAAVTGMGVMSKVTTMVFTVDPALSATKSNALSDTVTIKITNAPKAIVAGKSFKFEAMVTSSDKTKTVAQNVTWRIMSYSGGDLSKCKINASNGTLTTVAGKTGTVTISCSTPDSRARTTATVQISNASPVKALTLSATNTALSFKYGTNSSVGNTSVVYVSSMADTAGHNLLTDNVFTSSDKSLQWVSSNSNIVAVTGDTTYNASIKNASGKSVTKSVPAVNIKAVGAGTATITCKALDGSGRSAKITVKVTADQTKKVTAINLYEGTGITKSSTPVTAKSVFAGSSSFVITSKQTCADNGSNYITPTWSTSNAKIAQIQANGTSVTITPLAKGTANITCAAADGSGKKAVLKVTVLQPVTSVTVSGQKYIAAGTNAKYTATVLPATANNKKVTWSFSSPSVPSGVTLNAANGTVSVAKGVKHSGKIEIRATADDGSKCLGTYSFEIHDKAAKVTAAVDTSYSNTIATFKKGDYQNQTRIIAQILDSAGSKMNTEVAFSSSNTKVATVKADSKNPNIAIVTAVGKGTATITATAQDGSKKSAGVKINVVQLVENVVVTGQPAVALGNKATFKATVYPASASNKKLKWDVYYSANSKHDSHVTISQSGVVTVAPDAPAGTLVVTATPMDTGMTPDSHTWATFKTEPCRANHLTITAPRAWRNESINAPVEKTDALTKVTTITSCRIYDTNIADKNSKSENEILLQWQLTNADKNNVRSLDASFVQWASSNSNVARVDVESRQIGGKTERVAVVKAVKAGTATITCTATDGSNTKASVKVTVITPASGIEVVAGNNLLSSGFSAADYDIAEGVSTTVKAPIGNAFGKPTVSKVDWSYELGCIKNGAFVKLGALNGTEEAKRLEYFCNQNKYFFTLSNGRLTVQNTAAVNKALVNINRNFKNFDLSSYPLAVRVTAKTTDGTNYSDSKIFVSIAPTTWVKTSYDDRYYNAYLLPARFINESVVPIRIESNLDTYYFVPEQIYSVTSSNPKVATGYCTYTALGDDTRNKNYVYVHPHGKGTATLTITALDGTNKKTRITIKVQ